MSIPQSAGGPIESKDDLIRHLSKGCKPRDAWRIGTEHEKFVFDAKSLRPIPYEGANGIGAILNGLTRFGWEKIEEDGKPPLLVKAGESFLIPRGVAHQASAPQGETHLISTYVVD